MALDVDVTTGYGPEIIPAPSPQNGTYMVYINYYGSGHGRWAYDREGEYSKACGNAGREDGIFARANASAARNAFSEEF